VFKTIKDIFKIKNILPTILYSSIPALLFYILSFNILKSFDYSTMEIIRDFAQQVHKSSFLGFLSTIGSWMWVSSAAIGFFTYMTGMYGKKYKELLLLLALFSMLLAIDDFFMIHDRYIDQNICYGTYMILAITLLVRHLKLIIEINGFAFLFAGGLLALSIFTDLIQEYLPFKYSNIQIFEEAFKFIGAGTWLYFVSLVGSYYLIETVNKKKR